MTKRMFIHGESHELIVLQVVESDGRGPRLLRVLHEDETVDVQDEMAFWTAWVKTAVLRAPKPN